MTYRSKHVTFSGNGTFQLQEKEPLWQDMFSHTRIETYPNPCLIFN